MELVSIMQKDSWTLAETRELARAIAFAKQPCTCKPPSWGCEMCTTILNGYEHNGKCENCHGTKEMYAIEDNSIRAQFPDYLELWLQVLPNAKIRNYSSAKNSIRKDHVTNNATVTSDGRLVWYEAYVPCMHVHDVGKDFWNYDFNAFQHGIYKGKTPLEALLKSVINAYGLFGKKETE